MCKSRWSGGIYKDGGKGGKAVCGFPGFPRPSFPRLISLLLWLLSSVDRESVDDGTVLKRPGANPSLGVKSPFFVACLLPVCCLFVACSHKSTGQISCTYIF